MVDVSLAHLDRPFDYLVPERLAGQARPGCRVRVRFAGQLADGYLLERVAASDHRGRLAYLERVVSPETVLTAEIAALAREVADRYGGTLADVLRLAIPPRHAGAERGAAEWPAGEGTVAEPAGSFGGNLGYPARTEAGSWTRYRAGTAFISALAAGRAPRAVWTALPGPRWPEEIAIAAGATAGSGRGVIIVVPDVGDLALVDGALVGVLGTGRHVSLSAGLGPAERYRRWLAVSRGAVRVVAGTRAAMFAPVANLGLAVIWDDGDDLHAEQRAPYPHAREVLALRAHRAGAAVLVGGFARTVEATSLVSRGWAAEITADRPVLRRWAPRVVVAGDDTELARDPAARARVPSLALRTARDGLAHGPVLVQVPRRGYVTAVACVACRTRARCGSCGGPLALATGEGPAQCRWCGHRAVRWECPECSHTGLRALVTGATRTAEELGRAFPGVRMLTSAGRERVGAIAGGPLLVVATPGAEPRAAGGYATAILLDGWVLLSRPSLRASEEALRRWMNAAALVRPGSAGGVVMVVADAGLPPVQALLRWDPVTYAERELAERTQLHFPPASRVATLTGPSAAVAAVLAAADLPAGAEVLGPIPVAALPRPGSAHAGNDEMGRGGPGDSGAGEAGAGDTRVEESGAAGDGAADAGGADGGGTAPAGGAGSGGERVRVLVRVERSRGLELALSLRSAQAVRSARKDPGAVRLHLDPVEVI
jgi:primosomal protein N' (replication factor Y)